MKTVQINRCRLCGSEELISVFDFGSQALSTRFPGPSDPDAEIVPLELVQCQNKLCNLTQLTHDYDFDDLYRLGYGYRSGVNNSMRSHLSGIVADLKAKLSLEPNDVVLDIASNDGTLLSNFDNESLSLIGIDPTIAQYRSYYPEKNYYLSDDFFSADTFLSLSPKNKAKAVFSIAVFYDVPDPISFMRDVSSILDKSGMWVMEQSYLPLLVRDLAFDSICHEHLGYYGIKQIKYAAEQCGLKVVDATTNPMNGGSLRLFICHQDNLEFSETDRLQELLSSETTSGVDKPETFVDFFKSITAIGDELIATLKKIKSQGKSIHIYGASTKGNVLLQLFNIDGAIIDYAAERNEWKYGHRTPGTNIPIISEADSRAMSPDYYLVLPWHFRDEFIEREKDYLEQGGSLIFPLPQVEVFSSK